MWTMSRAEYVSATTTVVAAEEKCERASADRRGTLMSRRVGLNIKNQHVNRFDSLIPALSTQ